jgi:hypothetical protein
MTPRIVPDAQVPAPAIQPAAQPVDTYYSPAIPQQTYQQILDLSPLSEALQKIVSAQQDKQNKEDVAAGASLAAGVKPSVLQELQGASVDMADKAAVRKRNQDYYARLVARGVIPENASPWTYVGFQEQASRSIMGAYSQAVESRMADVAAIVDPKTGLPQDPTKPEQVLSEEWAKLADNPVLQSFYGSQVANQMKSQVDEHFRQAAGKAYGEAVVAYRKDALATAVGQQLTGWSAQTDPASPSQVTALETFIANEMRDKSVEDPRSVVMTGIKYAASKAGEHSGDEAVRLLNMVRDLKVGGTTIGSDAHSGTELEGLLKQYRDQADSDVSRAAERAQARYKSALLAADKEVDPLLSQAVLAKGDPYAAYQRWAEVATAKQSFGPDTGTVVLAKGREALAYANAPQAENKALELELVKRIDAGDGLDTIGADVSHALQAGQLSAGQYDSLKARVDKRADLSPLVEQNPAYASALHRIDAASTLKGFPPEVQAQFDARAGEPRDAFISDAAAFAATVAGKPDAQGLMRSWLADREKATVESIRSFERDVQAKRAGALDQIREQLAHSTDATELIKKNAELLTQDETAQLLDRSRLVGDRTRFFNTQEYRDAEGRVAQAVNLAAGEDLGGLSQARQSAAVNDQQVQWSRALRGAAAQWLDENAPRLAPSTLPSAFNAFLQTKADEIKRQIGGSNADTGAAQTAAGASTAEVVSAAQKVEGDQADAAGVTADIKSGAADPYAKLFTAARLNPNVDPRIFDQQHKYLNGTVDLPAVQYTQSMEAAALVANPALSNQQRADAAVSLYQNVGIPAEAILSGTLEAKLPPAIEARATSMRDSGYSVLAAAIGTQPWLITDLKAAAEAGRALKDPVYRAQAARGYAVAAAGESILRGETPKFDISKASIAPYTTRMFQTRAELEAFSLGPQMAPLMARLGVPTDNAAQAAWIASQALLIQRNR